MTVKFAPSLMCMDLLKIREQIEALNRTCDLFHADIMDGHFCKNITLSPDFIRAIRPVAKKPIDVHLMVTCPGDYIDALADAGADYLSVHLETINTDAFRLLRRIKEKGCKFGLVLNPATPLWAARHLLGQVDLLTIMTVDVGFAGQSFIPEMLSKIREAEQLRLENGYSYFIQSDGSNNAATYRELYQAGARCFVVGSSGLFSKHPDLNEAWAIMKREFCEAVEKGGKP